MWESDLLLTYLLERFHEEQFGPLVPISRYTSLSEVTAALKASWNGEAFTSFIKSLALTHSLKSVSAGEHLGSL